MTSRNDDITMSNARQTIVEKLAQLDQRQMKLIEAIEETEAISSLFDRLIAQAKTRWLELAQSLSAIRRMSFDLVDAPVDSQALMVELDGNSDKIIHAIAENRALFNELTTDLTENQILLSELTDALANNRRLSSELTTVLDSIPA